MITPQDTIEPPLTAKRVSIKTVRPLLNRLTGKANNDFDNADASEVAQYAMTHDIWQYQIYCGEPLVAYNPDPTQLAKATARARSLLDTRTGTGTAHLYLYETSIAICAPDGRIALWHGKSSATTVGAYKGLNRTRIVDRYAAALATFAPYTHANTDEVRAAYYWSRNVNRGGARDARPLAAAACRVMHAKAFTYTATPRDTLLAHMLDLPAQARPTTNALLNAKEDTLAAASVLLLAGLSDAAVACVRRGGLG